MDPLRRTGSAIAIVLAIGVSAYVLYTLRTPPRPLLMQSSAGSATILGVADSDARETVLPNDNVQPAGRVRSGTLVLELEARTGVWQPDGAAGPAIRVHAFGEAGAPLRNPGPLLHVTAGTEIRVGIRNALNVPLVLHGLNGRVATPLRLAPGEHRRVRIRFDRPGVYAYAGVTTGAPPHGRAGDDSQLNGAIVVDAAVAATVRERGPRVVRRGGEDVVAAAPPSTPPPPLVISQWLQHAEGGRAGIHVVAGNGRQLRGGELAAAVAPGAPAGRAATGAAADADETADPASAPPAGSLGARLLDMRLPLRTAH